MQNAEEWIRAELRGILEWYSADRVFNADETGLCFRSVPDGLLCYAREKLKGSKKAMDRLTIFVHTNVNGTAKKKLLVIGVSKMLQRFGCDKATCHLQSKCEGLDNCCLAGGVG